MLMAKQALLSETCFSKLHKNHLVVFFGQKLHRTKYLLPEPQNELKYNQSVSCQMNI